MIPELDDIRIRPGQDAAFEEAVQRGIDMVAARARGFYGHKLNRGIESHERYLPQVFWDTLEDHTVAFRQGSLFAEWCAILGPVAAAPSAVEHLNKYSDLIYG